MYKRNKRMYQDCSGMYRSIPEQELEEEECKKTGTAMERKFLSKRI
jgi:hypothetical protein